MEASIRLARVLFYMYPICNVNLRPIIRGLKLHYIGHIHFLQFLPLVDKDSAYVLLKDIRIGVLTFLREYSDKAIDLY
jgi:hypothetical protein